MEESVIRISGSEDDIRAFQADFLAYLRSQQLATEGIEVSDPEPVKPSLTDRAPLGHLPLLAIGVTLLKDVVAPVAVGVLKEWITSYVKQRGLKVQEGKSPRRTTRGKQHPA